MTEASTSAPSRSLLPTPIKLTGIRMNGFAAASGYAGETLPILIRAVLNSDQPEFHIYMREITNLLVGSVRNATGGHLQVDQIASFVLVTHEDGTADLYVEDIPREAEILAKRAIAAGEEVYLSSMADVRRLRIPGLPLQPKDGVAICFKVGWKFSLFFDLGAGRSIDVDAMERSLGSMYRYLIFEEVYAALGDPALVERLTQNGWFPFIEILGGEFEKLLKANRLDFNTTGQEEVLLKAFDAARIDAIADRWWRHPRLAGRRAVLEPALKAFKEGEPVASLKIILTEIEGIIQEAHIAELGKGAGIKKLLEYAIEKGVKKTESDTSLFLPKPFLGYLKNYTYAHFDPKSPQKEVMSRHSVGHGGADATAYTPQRALQAILTSISPLGAPLFLWEGFELVGETVTGRQAEEAGPYVAELVEKRKKQMESPFLKGPDDKTDVNPGSSGSHGNSPGVSSGASGSVGGGQGSLSAQEAASLQAQINYARAQIAIIQSQIAGLGGGAAR